MSRGRAYCRGPVKRGLDVIVALAVLLLLAPFLLLLALAILVASGRPVLFTQERIGMDGMPFRLLKFRSMRTSGEGGLPITGAGDPRVTGVGRFIRATKLDELPQLLNVVLGEMSLVGPRPEVPRYVAQYTALQRGVLEARPGLTDPASVLFRDEEALLGSVPDGSRERFYVDAILPKKLAMNLDYIERAGIGYDLSLILQTVKIVVWPPRD